jgi:hypothetical protein
VAMEMVTRARLARFAAMLFALGLFVCCARDPGAGGGWFVQQADDLIKQTVPPNSEVFTRSAPTPSGSTETACWEFDTTWDSTQYGRWVRAQLPPQFRALDVNRRRSVWVRVAQGDAEQLTIDLTPEADRVHVRVCFEAYSD